MTLLNFLLFSPNAEGKQNVSSIDFSKTSDFSLEGTLDTNTEEHIIELLIPEEGFLQIPNVDCIDYQISFLDSNEKTINILNTDDYGQVHVDKGKVKLKITKLDGFFLVRNDFYAYNIDLYFEPVIHADLTEMNEVTLSLKRNNDLYIRGGNPPYGREIVKITLPSVEKYIELSSSIESNINITHDPEFKNDSYDYFVEPNEIETISFLGWVSSHLFYKNKLNKKEFFIILENRIKEDSPEIYELKVNIKDTENDFPVDDHPNSINPNFTYMVYDFSESMTHNFSGNFDGSYDTDVFKFKVPKTGFISKMKSDPSEVFISAPDKNLLFRITNSSNTIKLDKGEYYLVARGYLGSSPYSIPLEFRDDTEGEEDGILNPSNKTIDLSKKDRFQIHGDYIGDSDFYKLIIPEKGKLIVRDYNEFENVEVLDENGIVIPSIPKVDGTENQPWVLNSGNYFLKVSSEDSIYDISGFFLPEVRKDDFAEFFIQNQTPEVDFGQITSYKFSGVLNDENDVDGFKLTIPKGGKYVKFTTKTSPVSEITFLKFLKFYSGDYIQDYFLDKNQVIFLPEDAYIVRVPSRLSRRDLDYPAAYDISFTSGDKIDEIITTKDIHLDKKNIPFEVSGTLNDIYSADFYKLTIPFKGKHKLTISDITDTINVDLFFVDKNKQIKDIYLLSFSRDYQQYSLLPGIQYYLRIQQSRDYSSNFPYTLNLNLEKTMGSETQSKIVFNTKHQVKQIEKKNNIIDHSNLRFIKTPLNFNKKIHKFKVIIPEDSYFSRSSDAGDIGLYDIGLYDKSGKHIYNNKINKGEYTLEVKLPQFGYFEGEEEEKFKNTPFVYLYTRTIPVPNTIIPKEEIIDHTLNKSINVKGHIDFKSLANCMDSPFFYENNLSSIADYRAEDSYFFDDEILISNSTYDIDRYKILIPKDGGTLNIGTNNKKCSFGRLFDEKGNLLDSVFCRDKSGNNKPYYDYDGLSDFKISKFLNSGIYYLDVGFIDDYGDYDLSSSLEPPKEKFELEGLVTYTIHKNDLKKIPKGIRLDKNNTITFHVKGTSDNLKFITLLEDEGEERLNKKPSLFTLSFHRLDRANILNLLNSGQINDLDDEEPISETASYEYLGVDTCLKSAYNNSDALFGESFFNKKNVTRIGDSVVLDARLGEATCLDGGICCGDLNDSSGSITLKITLKR